MYLSAPHVTERDRAALMEAFDSGWVAPVGPELDAFELEVAGRVGMAHAAALSSGTAALHLALLALGVSEGDDVIVSDLTFAATANAVRYVGARPVFIDCDENWNLDSDLLAEELEIRARQNRLPAAVIVVDLYGQVADFDAINTTCGRHGVPVIEDAAEALGATYRGHEAGSLADIGTFSFNGNKVITTSGGGMLVSNRQHWVDKARHLATQARAPVAHYEHAEVGFNYRLSNLLAALGRSQLSQLDERVARRREINAFYRAALDDEPGVDFMPDAGTGRPSWWLTCLTIDPAAFGVNRDAVRKLLDRHDIEARPTWKPMHLQPAFAGAPACGGKASERIFERGLCLPSGSVLTDSDLERVVELFRSSARP